MFIHRPVSTERRAKAEDRRVCRASALPGRIRCRANRQIEFGDLRETLAGRSIWPAPCGLYTWNLLGEFTGNWPDLSPGSPPIVRGTFRQDLVDDGRARERLADAAFADDAEDNGQADAIEGAKDVAMGGEFDNQIEDREEEMAGAQMPGQARP